MRAVRAEAGLDRGPITIEELHLGLRALELSARSDEESQRGGDRCSGARLQVLVWREVLGAYVEAANGAAAEAAAVQDSEGLAAVLSRTLALGAAGVEREA